MFGHDDHDDDNNQPLVGQDMPADTGADTGVGPTPMPSSDNNSLDANSTQAMPEPPQDIPHQDPAPTPVDEPIEPDHQIAEESQDEEDASDAPDDELLHLKRQALEELSPLVDHLEQTPEEKFKTTMMMIQATDSANLVQVAFDAAQKIEDEKERAQALLDIVNEINYFTQK